MGDLVQVADGAYPKDDYSFLPASVRAWGGYVGGHTPHDWTKDEVAHLEATGRAWWGIWTAPEARALTLTDATEDAANMAHGLAALGRPKVMPVFWDVEYSTYHADPQAANKYGPIWCTAMNSLGYPNAGWYGPCDSNASWRACWTGQAPATLPNGVLGVQYDHALHNDAYDISVFDPSLFTGGTEMTQPQVDSILARIDKLESDLTTYDTQNSSAPTLATTVHMLLAMRDGDTGHHDLPKLQSRLDDLSGAVAGMRTGELAQLATALADLSAQVAKLQAASGAPQSYTGTVTMTPAAS